MVRSVVALPARANGAAWAGVFRIHMHAKGGREGSAAGPAVLPNGQWRMPYAAEIIQPEARGVLAAARIQLSGAVRALCGPCYDLRQHACQCRFGSPVPARMHGSSASHGCTRCVRFWSLLRR